MSILNSFRVLFWTSLEYWNIRIFQIFLFPTRNVNDHTIPPPAQPCTSALLIYLMDFALALNTTCILPACFPFSFLYSFLISSDSVHRIPARIFAVI